MRKVVENQQMNAEPQEVNNDEVDALLDAAADASSALVKSKSVVQQKDLVQPSRFNHANAYRYETSLIVNEDAFERRIDGLRAQQEASVDDSESKGIYDDYDEELKSQDIDTMSATDSSKTTEKEKKYAVIDSMSMADFDSLVPEENRAIVYPFEMDDFQKRAVYRLE